MEFLVTISQDWPALRMLPERAKLIAAERRVGRALVEEGVLVRIWRIPGARANVGIWRAADATELDQQLARLPLRPWLTADVTALAEHELEHR